MSNVRPSSIGCPKVFCPVEGQVYFYILPCTDKLYSSKQFVCADAHDRENFFIGNCFETEQEVIEVIEHLRVRALLRYYSSQANWFNPTPCTPFWGINQGTNRVSLFCLDFSEDNFREGVFFPSREAFEQAVEKIGLERIKRYLIWG